MSRYDESAHGIDEHDGLAQVAGRAPRSVKMTAEPESHG